MARDDAPETSRRPRSRRGQGGRLREEILTAAIQLLTSPGRAGELSLRAVARAAGIATTSIYLHFDSLDELTLAVKIRCLEEFGQALATAAGTAPGDDAPARIRAWAHEYARYGLANRGRYWIMFTLENLPADLVPVATDAGMDMFRTIRDEFAAVLGAGADPAMPTTHLWTALHGIVTLRAARDSFPWPPLADEIDDLVGLLAHPRPAPTRSAAPPAGGSRPSNGVDPHPAARRGRQANRAVGT